MPSPLSIAKRWKIVFLHHENHLSSRQIAKQLKCSHTVVVRILKLYKQTKKVNPRTHSGRPHQLTSKQKNILKRVIRRHNNLTSEGIEEFIKDAHNINISSRTIRRERKKLGFHSVKERIIHEFTNAEKKRRVKYCEQNKNNNWRNVAFSDEKIFSLSKTTNRVWIEYGKQIPSRSVKNKKITVMVWGAVWYQNRTEICIAEENIKSTYYTKILGEYLLPSIPTLNKFRLLQDNARPHTAKNTQKWLTEIGVQLVTDYPSHSPDLNIMEKIWAWMIPKVNAEKPKTKAQLIRAIQIVWDLIPKKIIHNFIDYLPTVVQEVIDKKGEM